METHVLTEVSHVICPYLNFSSQVQFGSTCTDLHWNVCQYIFKNGTTDRRFLNHLLYIFYNDMCSKLETKDEAVRENGGAFLPLRIRYWNNTDTLFARVFLLGDSKIDTMRGEYGIGSGLAANDKTIVDYYNENGINRLRRLFNLIFRRLRCDSFNKLLETWFYHPSMLDCFAILFEPERLCNVCMHEHDNVIRICPTCLTRKCSTSRIYELRACERCLASIRMHRRDRLRNDHKRRKLMQHIRWHCPMGNFDCERYGHEGQGCQCECHENSNCLQSYPVAYYPPTDESQDESEEE